MIDSSTRSHTKETGRIAIIGGGFSGASVVYHVARTAAQPLDITLFEPRDRVGRGIAYSTSGDHLLLNVAAGRLSIDPGLPGDFLVWCHARGHSADASSFLPRAWFGEYVEARLTDQLESAQKRVTLRRVQECVTRLTNGSDGLLIEVAGSELHRVDHAVLALGHGPTRVPKAVQHIADSPLVLHSPWDHDAMKRVAETAERALLIGTGLTMCDAAITLSRLGFQGEMTAISRRGLVPQVHGESTPTALAAWRDALPTGSLHELRHSIRRAVRTHGWRSVIDAIRPRTAELWSGLSQVERTRFMSRLAPYWDAHRHRLPPECTAAIALFRDRRKLRVLQGTVSSVLPSRSGLTCELSTSGTPRSEVLHADAIVLCTGPEPDPRRWPSPLVRQLVNDGLASPDALGLGLRTTSSGLLVGRGAIVQSRLSTLGPLRRGSLWESTAVPELSAQAASLGSMLTAHQTGSVRTPAHPITHVHQHQ